MKKAILFSTLLSANLLGVTLQTTHAAAVDTRKAPEFKLVGTKNLGGLEIVATPPEGHHFNIKAPMSIVLESAPPATETTKTEKPVAALESKIRFRVASAVGYRVSLFICDDAKTFCEKHVVHATWDSKNSQLISETSTGDKLVAQTDQPIDFQKASGSEKLSSSGLFSLNNADAALAEAKKTQKPLLIDFFGIWCPPCNELDEEVFSSDEFQRASAHFVRLKLDGDRESSWMLKSKFKVGGYPTIVFATSDGEEISRVVGFRNTQEIVKQLNEAWEFRTVPVSSLAAQAKKGNRLALDRLGLAHLERKEYAEAIRQLENSKKYREQFFEAKIGQLKATKEKEKPAAARTKEKSIASAGALIQVLHDSIQAFPHTPGSIERQAELASLYAEQQRPAEQKKVLGSLLKNAQFLVDHPTHLATFEMTAADLWASMAEAEEALGKSDLAKTAWASAAAEYRKKIVTGRERGYHLELAYCLGRTGDYQAAEQIYEKFEHAYPEEFTFYFNHASMELAQKKFAEAEKLAQTAINYSYVDNKLRVTYLLAEAMQSQGRKADALREVRSVIQTTQVPEDAEIRTHRYFKKLQDLEKELSGATSA
jgi:tetratricopeptide (TPR) repeat protein